MVLRTYLFSELLQLARLHVCLSVGLSLTIISVCKNSWTSRDMILGKYQLQYTPTSGLGPAHTTPTSIYTIINYFMY